MKTTFKQMLETMPAYEYFYKGKMLAGKDGEKILNSLLDNWLDPEQAGDMHMEQGGQSYNEVDVAGPYDLKKVGKDEISFSFSTSGSGLSNYEEGDRGSGGPIGPDAPAEIEWTVTMKLPLTRNGDLINLDEVKKLVDSGNLDFDKVSHTVTAVMSEFVDFDDEDN